MEKFIKEIEELEQKRIDYMLSHKTTKRSKVKDKIEELENDIQELSDEQGYWGSNDLLIKLETLKELLEEEYKI